MAAAAEQRRLHVLFFPFMTASHIIPMMEVAAAMAGRGVRAIVLTTPGNGPLVRSTVDRPGISVELLLIPFPASEVGLPEGLETLPSPTDLEKQNKFFEAAELLCEPFEGVLRALRPACVVSDMFFHWTTSSARALGIPRLMFYVFGFAGICTLHAFDRAGPELYTGSSGDENVVVLGLPHRVEMRRSQLAQTTANPYWRDEVIVRMYESEAESYGILVNSLYEMERPYVDHYRDVIGRRAWHVGQVHAPRSAVSSNASSGREPCLAWLDPKAPNSVVYAGFGVTFRPTRAQLREIALGLEASGHPFIWVAREEEWIPEGFEERVQREGRGLVLKKWVSQVDILSHEATGAFLSQCGWNAVMEAMGAGVPVIAWPVFGDQYDAARLLVDELGVGVRVGPEAWGYRGEDEDDPALVGAEEIARAVAGLMGGGGDGVEGIRKRAMELQRKMRLGVKEGGSSYVDMGRLIDELDRLQLERLGPNREEPHPHHLRQ